MRIPQNDEEIEAHNKKVISYIIIICVTIITSVSTTLLVEAAVTKLGK